MTVTLTCRVTRQLYSSQHNGRMLSSSRSCWKVELIQTSWHRYMYMYVNLFSFSTWSGEKQDGVYHYFVGTIIISVNWYKNVQQLYQNSKVKCTESKITLKVTRGSMHCEKLSVGLLCLSLQLCQLCILYLSESQCVSSQLCCYTVPQWVSVLLTEVFIWVVLFSQNRISALMLASREGSTEIVSLLLQHAAQPDLVDEVIPVVVGISCKSSQLW